MSFHRDIPRRLSIRELVNPPNPKYKGVSVPPNVKFTNRSILQLTKMTGMDVSYGVFRGSSEGEIISDQTTSILEHGDVFIETTHSGLCGTDEHYLKSDQVLGHEGVGIIKAVGPGVTSVKVGDRVGFGYTHSICGNCDNCASGKFPFFFISPSTYFFLSPRKICSNCV